MMTHSKTIVQLLNRSSLLSPVGSTESIGILDPEEFCVMSPGHIIQRRVPSIGVHHAPPQHFFMIERKLSFSHCLHQEIWNSIFVKRFGESECLIQPFGKNFGPIEEVTRRVLIMLVVLRFRHEIRGMYDSYRTGSCPDWKIGAVWVFNRNSFDLKRISKVHSIMIGTGGFLRITSEIGRYRISTNLVPFDSLARVEPTVTRSDLMLRFGVPPRKFDVLP